MFNLAQIGLCQDCSVRCAILVFKLGTIRMPGLLYFMFSLVLKLGANWIPGLLCLCAVIVLPFGCQQDVCI